MWLWLAWVCRPHYFDSWAVCLLSILCFPDWFSTLRFTSSLFCLPQNSPPGRSSVSLLCLTMHRVCIPSVLRKPLVFTVSSLTAAGRMGIGTWRRRRFVWTEVSFPDLPLTHVCSYVLYWGQAVSIFFFLVHLQFFSLILWYTNVLGCWESLEILVSRKGQSVR